MFEILKNEVAYLKKKEFIFIGALLAVSVLLCVYVYVLPHVKYGSIQITVDGELYGTYSLGKDQVIALSVSYGQKHDKEIRAAIAVAEYYGVEHLFLDCLLYTSPRPRDRG